MIAQRGLLLLFLLAAACGERAAHNNVQAGGGATTPPYVRAEEDPSLLDNATMAVRVGELGPGFAACNARGAARDRTLERAAPIHAAPYESNRQIDTLPIGTEFFICSRTHDQRWFGIVYPRAGQAAESCGVAGPVARREDYRGLCASGWVSSALVRLVSGIPHQLPPPADVPVPPPVPSR